MEKKKKKKKRERGKRGEEKLILGSIFLSN